MSEPVEGDQPLSKNALKKLEKQRKIAEAKARNAAKKEEAQKNAAENKPKQEKNQEKQQQKQDSNQQKQEKPQQNQQKQEKQQQNQQKQEKQQQNQQKQEKQQKPKQAPKPKAEAPQPPQAPKSAEPDEYAVVKKLFPHIPIVSAVSSQQILEKATQLPKLQDVDIISRVHPALIEFILTTSSNLMVDENEKCCQFLTMMKTMINDLPILDKEPFTKTILDLIKLTMGLLTSFKASTPGLGNCVRFIKAQLKTDSNTQDKAAFEELRKALIKAIDEFITQKIEDPSKHIEQQIVKSISDGDVILTYGFSSIILEALKQASNERNFRVIVVDSCPTFNSRQIIGEIPRLDIRYVLLSGISYVMPEVTKVLIEPCGILSNNAALTAAGTAMISMVAHEFGIPVVFICNCYRFVADVRVDALSKNEIIDKKLLAENTNEKLDNEYLALVYDMTPGEYVNVVISEIGKEPVNSISTNMKYIQESYTFYSKAIEEFKKKNKSN